MHGGADGVRDETLLLSALARPRQRQAVKLAALYTTGIVRNRPFVNGNTRTGFVIGVLFLELNGYVFTAGEEDAARAVIALASGALDEAGYAAFLAANVRSRKSRR